MNDGFPMKNSDGSYLRLNPAALLGPVPAALVSCAEKDHPENRNLLTVAWTGTINTDPPMVSISIRKSRYSHDLIRDSGEFVLNLTDESMCKAVDFCGVRSGRDLDKAAETGLAYRPADGLSVAPAVNEAPVCLCCRVQSVLELGSHDLFLSQIVAVMVRPDLMDEKGGLHLEKARLIGYSHGLYHRLGGILGFFGWSVAREDVFLRLMEQLNAGPSYTLKSARYLARDALLSAIHPGDRVIDATMGNGHDTEFLCDAVGPGGLVYAFDIQSQAVRNTEDRLRRRGLLDRARLFALGHEKMADTVSEPVSAIVFNLGWLPGGDHRITTRWETTRRAVESGLGLLKPSGILVLCVYPGHPEGDRELRQLLSMLSGLSNREYNVLRQSFLNASPGAPECLIVQKLEFRG